MSNSQDQTPLEKLFAVPYAGVVLNTSKTVKVQSNGSKVMYNTVKITDGPFKGENITCKKTIFSNETGKTKDPVQKDDVVGVYHSQDANGTFWHAFADSAPSATQDTLAAKLAAFMQTNDLVESELESQAI